MITRSQNKYLLRRAPLLAALIFVLVSGLFLINRAAAQTRDTTRKHHLEDIENSLYFARNLHGTYPPYDQPSWCGLLNHPSNRQVRDQVEITLRQQHEKYANPDKPFPNDPSPNNDYFYWKHSPNNFELYATLEQDKNGERNTSECNNAPKIFYDYGLNSIYRDSQ